MLQKATQREKIRVTQTKSAIHVYTKQILYSESTLTILILLKASEVNILLRLLKPNISDLISHKME